MQHDYSVLTQRVFAALFGIFALVGPVIGVTFSESFGVRAQIVINEQIRSQSSDSSASRHEKFFCSEWAGNCAEKELMSQISKLIE